MSGKRREVEVIARGVLISRGNVLLCRSKGARNTYLPGGHVEFGESARHALRRELEEESGLNVRIGRFLGCVEHTFIQKGRRHCEINLVFRMSGNGSAARDVASREDWIGFLWAPFADIDSFNLQPAPLRGLIRALTATGAHGRASWGSTYRSM